MQRNPSESTNEQQDSPEQASASISSRQRRPVIRGGRFPFEINWSVMLVIVTLIALTVFILLLNRGVLPSIVEGWWPLALALPALFWTLLSLIRRDARGMLAGMALLGLSISLLLATLDVAPFSSTAVGITLIAAGAGIILRGLLLRRQPISW